MDWPFMLCLTPKNTSVIIFFSRIQFYFTSPTPNNFLSSFSFFDHVDSMHFMVMSSQNFPCGKCFPTNITQNDAFVVSFSMRWNSKLTSSTFSIFHVSFVCAFMSYQSIFSWCVEITLRTVKYLGCFMGQHVPFNVLESFVTLITPTLFIIFYFNHFLFQLFPACVSFLFIVF